MGLVSNENAFDISHMLLGMDIMYATGKQASCSHFTKMFVPLSARDTGTSSAPKRKIGENSASKHKRSKSAGGSKDSDQKKSRDVSKKEKKETNQKHQEGNNQKTSKGNASKEKTSEAKTSKENPSVN